MGGDRLRSPRATEGTRNNVSNKITGAVFEWANSKEIRKDFLTLVGKLDQVIFIEDLLNDLRRIRSQEGSNAKKKVNDCYATIKKYKRLEKNSLKQITLEAVLKA